VIGTWAPLHLWALLAIGGGLVVALVADRDTAEAAEAGATER